MDLKRVIKSLERFASISLKADWDNVGLLIEPSKPREVKKIGLTIDLTEEVMKECIDKGADLIVAYHPPIFRPLKKLTQKDWKERVVISCIENNVALFSPHTCWDAVQNGINDWLIRPYGPGEVEPLEPTLNFLNEFSHEVTVSCKPENFNELKEILPLRVLNKSLSENLFVIPSNQAELKDLLKLLTGPNFDIVSVTKLEKVPTPNTGMGRRTDSILLSEAVQRTKSHLKLSNLRVAVGRGLAMDSNVKTVAVCAGSGASILTNVVADLLVTGEMSHHEVLGAVQAGTSVILCEHSNTERGFLNEFASHFKATLEGSINIFVCEQDKDSLIIV